MLPAGVFITMMPRFHPDAGAADDLEVRRRVDHVGLGLRGAADHQRVVVPDDGLQLLGLEAGLHVHLNALGGLEDGQTLLGEGIADEHLLHGAPLRNLAVSSRLSAVSSDTKTCCGPCSG
jgi:hypothetical protein